MTFKWFNVRFSLLLGVPIKPKIDRIVFANHLRFTRVKPRIVCNIESSFIFFYIRYYERTICLTPQKIVFSTCNRFIHFKLRILTNKALKKRIKASTTWSEKKYKSYVFCYLLFFFNYLWFLFLTWYLVYIY
jgi:hypothetical protein